VSKEWAVISLDKSSGGFSAKGDSGSVVVDGLGRIVGMITGGSGATETSDVTFVTPIDFIMEIIHWHNHEPLPMPISGWPLPPRRGGEGCSHLVSPSLSSVFLPSISPSSSATSSLRPFICGLIVNGNGGFAKWSASSYCTRSQ
jgi:hypothetical protein